MGDILSDWKRLLGDFQSSVTKDLNEIRKYKAEIQQMKTEMFDRFWEGKIIRDEKRIVLSAPEIIIGNVDAVGDLSGDGGTVVIKGGAVALDGVGEEGSISSRAATIRQTAVDPGIDGVEEVVRPTSLITSQAKNIVLQSNNPSAGSGQATVFAGGPLRQAQGITIHSDTTMVIDASVSSEKRKKEIESRVTKLEGEKVEMDMLTTKTKVNLEEKILQWQTTVQTFDALNASNELTRMNYQELQVLKEKAEEMLREIYRESMVFVSAVSTLAELNRQIDALDKECKECKECKEFKKSTTKAALALSAELIAMQTVDGDGNFKENDEAGVLVNTPRMDVTMQKEDGSLAQNSSLTVLTERVSVSTANPHVTDSSTDLPAGGSVSIVSKKINLTAMDYEAKDKKAKKKALAKEGKITLRAEKVKLSAVDTEGKAAGAIDINGKTVALKTMDEDKENHSDKGLAEGSTMLVAAEKMYVGAKDKGNKSKQLQVVSEELGLFADKTLEAQQGEGKAVLQLADGDAALSGSKTEVYGATTLNGKTEVKEELKAPKATLDNVEAKTSFKSSNISDGIPVPPPPSTAKLSAKLKIEN